MRRTTRLVLAMLLGLILPLQMAASQTSAPFMEVSRKAYERGETIEVKMAVPESVNVTDSRLRSLEPGIGQVPLSLPPEGTGLIETGSISPGRYRIELLSDKEVVAAVPVVVQPARRPPMWFGNFIAPNVTLSGKSGPEAMKDLGFNIGYVSGLHEVDNLFQQRIYSVWHSNIVLASTGLIGKERMEKWGVRFGPADKPATVWSTNPPCVRNPEVHPFLCQSVDRTLDPVVGYPGFVGLGLDDEMCMRQIDWNDTGSVTCYCDYCKNWWRARTGQEAPMPEALPPGTVVPSDDPYTRWMLENTGPGYYWGPSMEVYNRMIKEHIHEKYPGVTVFQTPGAPTGELDAAHWEIYSYIYGGSANEAYQLMSYLWAMQGRKGVPMWPLIGWFESPPATSWTGAHIETQSKASLAEGASAIWLTIMWWYDGYGKYKPAMLYGAEQTRPHLLAVADIVRRYGALFKQLEAVNYPVAVLYSHTTEGHQSTVDPKLVEEAHKRGSWLEVPWQHMQSHYAGFPALLRDGVPAEVVTEYDILDGRLGEYEALVLIDHEYARQSVVDAIAEFSSQPGKVVFADRGSLIRPENAVELPYKCSVSTQMINLALRPQGQAGEIQTIVNQRLSGIEREAAVRFKPALDENLPEAAKWVKTESDEIIVRARKHGESRYIFILSADCNARQQARIEVKTPGRYAYEIFSSSPTPLAVTDGRLVTTVDLAPGGWKVYAVTPEPVVGLKLEASYSSGMVEAAASVVDPSGRPVDAALPIEFELVGPGGVQSPYSGFGATAHGSWTETLPVSTNEPRGNWTLRVTNLATGDSAEARLTVN